MPPPLNLTKTFSTTLGPTAPFNFDATVHKPSHFPSSDNAWAPGKYWITMVWCGDVLGLKLENKGTVARPKIKLTVYSRRSLTPKTRQEIIPEIVWRFNLHSDVSEFCRKFKNDQYLKKPLQHWRGMRPVAANSFYETLIIYVVLQNAVVSRTVQMLENLFNSFGRRVKFNNQTLTTFWEPKRLDKVPEQKLRDLKLGYRAKFIKQISTQFARGAIDEPALRKMSKDEVREEALKLYGIGPASVQYLLFEDFYHYDAFDTVPPWEQKIYSRLLYNKKLVPAGKILRDINQRYGQWSKLAIHYIWEDIFWQRQTKQIEWLEKEIRL